MAERTPPTRNRYVDFLRAASITVVVLGHWLMAAAYMSNGKAELGHILDLSPWSHWLTWALQVMPIFFIVGGFSNSITWQKTQQSGKTYAEWLDSRFRRLVSPVLPLLAGWTILGAGAQFLDLAPGTLRAASQVALVPTWFLSVYLMVILAVPWTYRLWRSLGLGSVALLALVAALLDAVAFGAFGSEVPWLRWLNYGFVWAAVHQLGYAWREDCLGGWRAPVIGAGGLAALFGLVRLGPYPISMVGVPGEAISNSLPPTIALLALGIFQGGLLLSLEGPMRRWLDNRRAWAATVLVNANIMTLFLWHSTVMVLVIGALVALGGPGLGIGPATGIWWWSRIPWVVVLAVLLLPFLAAFGRFERAPIPGGKTPRSWKLLLGSLLFCFGIALLALEGVGGGYLGVRVGVLALPFVGAVLAGVGRKS